MVNQVKKMATQVKTDLIANNAITDAKIANVAITGVTASSGDSSTALATTAFVAGEINSLIDSAPGALNTLNELAAAMGDDANFSTTVTNNIATKLPLAGGTLTGDLSVPNISVADDIRHTGDSDTYISLDNNSQIFYSGGTRLLDLAVGDIIFNEGGGGVDFRVESGGNANMFFVDGSADKVGIGATTPSATLHVLGTEALTTGMVRFQNDMDNNYETLRIESIGNYDAHIGFLAGGSTNYYWGAGIDYSDAGKFKISNDNLVSTNTRLTITTGGDVGVGLTNPSVKLAVQGLASYVGIGGGSTGSAALYVNAESGHTGELLQILDKNNSQKMMLTNAGNLGLGAGLIESRRGLGIKGSSPGINFHDADVSNLNHEIIGGGNAGLEISADYNNVATSYIRFDIGGAEKMRIFGPDGQVGINKSSGLATGGFGTPMMVIKQKANSQWGGILIEAHGNDGIFAFGTKDDVHVIEGSYRSSAGYKPIEIRAAVARKICLCAATRNGG